MLSRRMAAPIQQLPTPQEEGTGGCRKGAEIRPHPHNARSKASSGGRPSAGEVPQSLPLAKDLWSSGEPLATTLPHRRWPAFRSAQSWSRVAQGGALVWRYEARPDPVKKAQFL